MESIKDKVAIIGMGCTRFGERWDDDVESLLVEAAYEAYEDAGIESKDIEAAWIGVVRSGFRGETLAHPLKFDYIPITRVENACATASDAFINACLAVTSRMYDIVMVAGVEKLKDNPYTGLSAGGGVLNSGVEPGAPPPVQFALAATRYAYHYNIPVDELKRVLAKIAVKNHHNGALNSKAHFKREITVDQVINAPMVAWPLGLFDCCGVSDGAACAIITRPEIAEKFRNDFILVKGLGFAVGARQGTLQDDYDFVHFEENVRASRMAYAQAGITDPFEEIDLAEVHDCFTITELITYEDLGFAPRGKAKELVNEGVFELHAKLSVNPDGGLKCFGHPVGATGLRMIYEIYKQLQGKAGPRQLKNPTLGLTHNLGGMPGAFSCSVVILGK